MNPNMNWRTYCGLYILNEMLFGQNEKQIQVIQRDMGLLLNVDVNNCYILLTGVKKQEYNKRLKIERTRFVELVYRHLWDYMKNLAGEEAFEYELGILNYDYSKRIVIIISPHRTRFDPMPCARRISSMIEEQYRQIGEANSYFTNIMAVSGHITGYEQIRSEFENLMHLHDLSFFHRTSQPLTKEDMEERRVAYSMVEAERAIDDFANAVYRQDAPLAEKLLHQLVIGYLKPCQDISFCRDAYYLLRQKVRQMGLVLGVPMHLVDDFPHMHDFISIEEQYDTMKAFLHGYFFPERRKPGCPGKLSILALTYINQNYYQPTLGLADVAKYIHTNTAYLSRVFKQEMGIGISEYINRLRMDQAARLLRETNTRIVSVAEKVGIEDARYFSSLFRRYMGTSPSLYRKRYMAGDQTDEETEQPEQKN